MNNETKETSQLGRQMGMPHINATNLGTLNLGADISRDKQNVSFSAIR